METLIVEKEITDGSTVYSVVTNIDGHRVTIAAVDEYWAYKIVELLKFFLINIIIEDE